MPLRFAAARTPGRSPIARALTKKATGRPANDNGDAHLPATGSRIDDVTRAALRHFAAHGLAAAEMARVRAESAHDAGDDQSYRWWLEMCRKLDSRLADRVEQRYALEELLA